MITTEVTAVCKAVVAAALASAKWNHTHENGNVNFEYQNELKCQDKLLVCRRGRKTRMPNRC